MSNTLSKVDAGYNGPLLVTLFNLGKNKVDINFHQRFCSLVVHDIASGAELYAKGAKRLEGASPRRKLWGQRVRNWATGWKRILQRYIF